MQRPHRVALAALASGAGLGLPIATASAETVYGVSDAGVTQSLVAWDSDAPGSIASERSISGLAAGESVLGIDFRPATGELFALGSSNKLYTLDPDSGSASAVGSGFTTASLDGTSFGFDFNPAIDRIRIVSDANQNLVGNPDTGDATDVMVTPVFYAAGDANEGADPTIALNAYDQNVAGTATTQLYAIDTGLNALVKQANSMGTLTTVGDTGVDFTSDLGGFDISGDTGAAFLAALIDGRTNSAFFSVNLQTGQVTEIGAIGEGTGRVITAIAVAPGGDEPNPGVIPTPAAAGIGLALLAATAAKRRRPAA